jgi:hypothetical protein
VQFLTPYAISSSDRKIYIQQKGNEQLEPEMKDLYDEFTRRGYEVELFTEKSIYRKRLKLKPTTMVAGDIPVVLSALKQLSLKIPLPNDYPQSLHPYLKRNIWESNVDRIRSLIYNTDFRPFFAKPKDRLKIFTGRVFESYEDLRFIYQVSKKTEVYCSEIVEWLSESRVFILHGKVIGIKHYSGDASLKPDGTVMTEAIGILEASGQAMAAYAIDFGILKNGETALVELNDAFSVGSYGLEPGSYADLTMARWLELMHQREDGTNVSVA